MTNAPRPATRDPRPATRDPRPIAQVDRIISWKFSCAACGQNCTTTVPVVNQVPITRRGRTTVPACWVPARRPTGPSALDFMLTRRTNPHQPPHSQEVNFAMPDCPVAADAISEVIDQVLPTDSPTDGVKVSASGSVDVKDESGAAVLALDLDITIQ
mmetsp:Transcript_27593/g.75100  ORF Transcript_27593/g.75100 Transcript_27593/m.75100 type:complete len:157 (+) Transcript_27593:498-968(+)